MGASAVLQRRIRRALFVTCAGVVSVAGGAAAAVRIDAGPGSPTHVSQLVARVVGATLHAPSCQLVSTGYHAQLTPAGAPAALRGRWAVLRTGHRAALPRDVARRSFADPTEILTRSARDVRLPDRTRWVVLVARVAAPTRPQMRDPAGCLDQRRRELMRLAGGGDASTVALADQALQQLSAPPPPTSGTRHEAVYGFVYDADTATYTGPYTSLNPYALRIVRSSGTLRTYLLGVVPDTVRRVALRSSGSSATGVRRTTVAATSNTYVVGIPGGATRLVASLRSASGRRLSSRDMVISAWGQR